jgi:hypothetical protein
MRKAIASFALFAAACGSGGVTNPGPDMASGGDTVSFPLKSWTLQPGEEKIYCQYVPPGGTTDRWISRFTTTMNAGSHHLVVFRINDATYRQAVPNPPTDPVPCTQIDIPAGFDGMLPGSQQLYSDVTLPDGVGFLLKSDRGLMFQEHYINATQQPITTSVTWSIGLVDAAKVQQPAGMIFFNNASLNIAPGMGTSAQIAEASCPSPGDVHLVTATGHMHKHGLTFDGTVGTSNVFHTNNWDEPNGNVFTTPGFAVAASDTVTWKCVYNNDTGAPLYFGNSAVMNEMCIFVALYYPSPGSTTDFCNR